MSGIRRSRAREANGRSWRRATGAWSARRPEASASSLSRVAAILVVSALAAISTSRPALAAPDDDPVEASGWEYGLMFGFGVHMQGLDGSAVSPDSLDPIRLGSGLAPGDAATTPFLSGTFRIYTPEDLLGDTDWTPRLVFDLGAEYLLDNAFRAGAYDFNFDVLDTGGGSNDPADYCPQEPPDPVSTCSYAARTGVDLLANWVVGVGLDFTLPVLEERYHVTPSFGYFGQAYESDGIFTVTLSSSLASDDIRPIKATSDVEILHGLYAGLGLGVDTWESGGFTSRLSLNGRAAYILSDREATYSGTNPIPTPNFNQADFLARPSSWVFNVFAGFEIRYDPSAR